MAESQKESHTKLVELARDGDKEAFTILFCEYQLGIYGYLVGLAGKDNAYDLTQETFTKALEKLRDLREASKFKSWLYSIARNLAYDKGRHKQKIIWQSLENMSEATMIAIDPDLAEHMAQRELIRLTLTQLPLKLRDCLLLYSVGGMLPRDIAEIVHLNEKSVITYICNARKQFREIYRLLESQLSDTERGS